MDRPVGDRDYVVIGGTREQLLRRYPHAKPVGKKIAVYYVHGDEYTLSTAKTIEEDLETRDLTINALAMDEDGRIIAHPSALEHLRAKLLYPVADDNFFVDPARVYRAARFAACLPDFSVHPHLLAVMRRVAAKGACRHLPAERVGKELMKSLAGSEPARFVTICRQGGALKGWFEELEQAAQVPAGPVPYHDETLLEHLCQVMDRLAGDSVRVWMGLCHDLGKIMTPQDVRPAHHGHDRAGVDIVRKLGKRLRLPSGLVRAGMAASRWHMTLARYDILRPGTRVDLLTSVGSRELLGNLCALVVADGGIDMTDRVLHDFRIIHNIHLPATWQGRGPRSGEQLRILRAQALVQHS
ncbi:tRNA nucleotidyltransferase [Desulfoplanes formicivorans]|uniref:tRNA nucleotidyltransferase n=1 Tax=Desulfoplanes formicivorans TaxID=1592317 RepID=A0A194AG58_9BACT|nr:tRNA nucleotidyltransferase [Desulfoplanes formicivorans]